MLTPCLLAIYSVRNTLTAMNLRESRVPHQHLEPYLQSEAEYLNKNYAMTDNARQFSKYNHNLSPLTV